MNNQIKNILRTILPTLNIVSFALESFDSDSIGLDDELAAQIRGVAVGAQAYLDSFPAEKQTIARGLQATKTFCENVLSSIDFVIASELTFEQKDVEIRRLVKSLSDDTQVYQSKKGNDAKYLELSKKAANEKHKVFLGLPL